MLPQPVISNNTPLATLWAVGQLSLLHSLFGTVLIPPAVYNEFVAIDHESRQQMLDSASWLVKTQLINPATKSAFSDLDEGEAEVLTLALELSPRLVIIDERRGRAYAKKLQLPMTGTVGVLLRAKEADLLDAIKPILEQIVANGFYLHPSVINRALTLAGESKYE